MTINVYENGQQVRCTCTFTVNSVNTDPTTVTAKVKDPSGVETSYVYGVDEEVVKSAAGIYYIDVTTDENGLWYFRFEGTGTCVAVEESAFRVRSVFS